MQYLLCSFWLTSLCTIDFRSIHVSTNDPILLIYIYIPHLFLQSSVNGHYNTDMDMDNNHVLAIVNSVAMNTGVMCVYSIDFKFHSFQPTTITFCWTVFMSHVDFYGHLLKWLNFITYCTFAMGFPGGSDGKESASNVGNLGSIPWVRKIPWRREWQPTPGFLPGVSHGQSNLVVYSPWGSHRVRHNWGTNTKYICIDFSVV